MIEALVNKLSKPIDLWIFFVTYAGVYLVNFSNDEPKPEIIAGICAIGAVGLRQFGLLLTLKYFVRQKLLRAMEYYNDSALIRKVESIEILLSKGLIEADVANQKLFDLIESNPDAGSDEVGLSKKDPLDNPRPHKRGQRQVYRDPEPKLPPES